jgi:5-methylcytosine-specific restriction endonuclease McrA
MAFSEETKETARLNAGGKCVCSRKTCTHHTGRCNATLTADNYHAHHKTAVASGGNDTLSNCEALCIRCHKNTITYGN